MNELPPDTQLRDGRYQVLERIGKGAFGLVYRAYDKFKQKLVALKQLSVNDPERVKSFRHEAELLAQLTHPNLPEVTDHFAERATWFLVMAFIPGATLLDRLDQYNAPLPPTEVLAWADQILAALEYLHGRKPSVIHRDIKPENLKLTPDGQVMLLDFGIAKGLLTADGRAILSQRFGTKHYVPPEQRPIPSQHFGTKHYAPPEQLIGTGTDARSDLYALAATLYHLLTDELPIDALERSTKKILQRQADPLVPLQYHVPTLPDMLNKVLLRALNLPGKKRYGSASEMRQALKTVASQLEPELPPASAPLPLLRRLFPTWPQTPPPQPKPVPSSAPSKRRPRPIAALPAWIPEMVEVPAGPFLMGSADTDARWDAEKPQHIVTLPHYWIGKTPVTNFQFCPFVEGDGYTNQAYWTAVGWHWREQEKVIKPRYWDDIQWNGTDHPVVGVSWFEALAYCRWLSAQTGIAARLPSEAEWEKAARGPDGKIYPWGNTWKAGCCNSEEANIKSTTPVAKYPTGTSPYGVLDMVGNVWEWCATRWGKSYPYQWEDEWQAAYLETDQSRVLRGGSWYRDSAYVRGAYRYSFIPRDRGIYQGLRVASHSVWIDVGS